MRGRFGLGFFIWAVAGAVAGLGTGPGAGFALAQAVSTPREVIGAQRPERAPPADAGAPLAVAPPEGAPVPEGGPSFDLRGVSFAGSSVYGEPMLAALVSDKIGRAVTFADLREITARVEQLYRDDGYIAVRAVIPAQRIESGVVQIRVVEGAIREIAIRGDLGRAESEVRRILSPLVDAQPLRGLDAERALLLARDLPGINLLAALRARPDGEAGDMVLLVEGVLTPFDGFASVSNLASDIAGPFVATLGGAVNSLIFSGDRLEVIALSSLEFSEEALGQITYDMPTGVSGLRASFAASSGLSESGDVLAPLDVDYRSRVFSLGLDYDLIRSRARSLSFGAGFEFVHQESNSVIPGLGTDEDLRVLEARVRLIEPGVLGGLLDSRARLRLGLGILGASEEGDPGLSGGPRTDPQFVAARAEFGYSRPLPEGFSLRADVRGQASSGDLPSYERFSLGNYTIGRGFDPGAASGDHGIAGSLTLSYRLELGELPVITAPELFGFVDTGRVWARAADASLTSVGFGARWQMFGTVDAEAYLAIPVQASDLVEDDDPRALFRITAFF